MNDNSSRFGKLIEIIFSAEGAILGGKHIKLHASYCKNPCMGLYARKFAFGVCNQKRLKLAQLQRLTKILKIGKLSSL